MIGEVLAVIVVNWNTPDLVLECLAALRRSEGVRWRLYLVDNASSDNSAARLADLGDDVTFIRSPVNGGWTGGNNLGIERAMADGHHRFFTLNSDAAVRPDTLRILMEEAERRPTAVLGPVQVSTCGRFYNFAGTTVAPETGMPTYPRTFPVDGPEAASIADLQPTAYVQGSGLLASREHFEQLGLFDDRYYLNYDDTDFCAKARAAGYEVLLVKAARLLHATSGSIGGGESPLNHYFLTRNSLVFAGTHLDARQRRTHWGQVIRSGMYDTGRSGRLPRIGALLFGGEPRPRVFRRALFDYLMGRLGECPPAVRRVHAEAQRAALRPQRSAPVRGEGSAVGPGARRFPLGPTT